MTDFCATQPWREATAAWASRVTQLASSQTACQMIRVDERHCLRGLYAGERQALVASGNESEEWASIKLLLPTEQYRNDQSTYLRRWCRDNRLEHVVLVVSGGTTADNRLFQGLHSNRLVAESIIDLQASMVGNTILRKSFIGPTADVMGCGRIDCGEPRAYGSLALDVGAESGGGRPLALTIESTIIDVLDQLTGQPSVAPDALKCDMNLIFGSIHDTPTVESVCLYESSAIEAACSVKNAVLLPQSVIRNGCTVDKVALQWSASIVDQSSVANTLLMEHAHAGPHSLVAASVLGPDVHVSAGEVHASVLGPNTNAHHQSLLISVLWLLGRGNVGYGANVGSNHTGRLPDQEVTAGEGIFWGLSTVVKMPVDLTAAPYTVIAAGTQLAPQRITMPFSLIVEDQILPGWVLRSSPYTLARSETKFAQRRQAKRHDSYTGWSILRAETIDLCVAARAALRAVGESKKVYTEKDIAGLGACRLMERGRQAGIQAYSDCIERFALTALWAIVERALTQCQTIDEVWLQAQLAVHTSRPKYTRGVEWNVFPWQVGEKERLQYEAALLNEEFPCTTTRMEWMQTLLLRLVQVEKAHAEAVFQSKHRDDLRGAATIPGYRESHVAADEDPVIVGSRKQAEEMEHKIHAFLGQGHRSKL